MKLSIVILCWNDRRVIADCLQSIFGTTSSSEFEVIVSDNGSTDDSVEFIRTKYPQVRIIENGVNLRFAKANNVGIRASCGAYVLILNPDTIIHEGTLDRMLQLADQYSEAGAFGCRVLNPDGTYQASAWPFTSFRSEWIAAFYLRGLGRLSDWFRSDSYVGWAGTTQREVDWVSGCFLFIRRSVLMRVGLFDEQFFYYYEDTDLCRRIRKAGYPILYLPAPTITHLGGQSTKSRFPALAFVLDSQITRYLYYYKYYGPSGARHARTLALVSLTLRRCGHRLKQLLNPTELGRKHLDLLRDVFHWNYLVDPVKLVEKGEEPRLIAEPQGRVSER